jgi:hypothetical protein
LPVATPQSRGVAVLVIPQGVRTKRTTPSRLYDAGSWLKGRPPWPVLGGAGAACRRLRLVRAAPRGPGRAGLRVLAPRVSSEPPPFAACIKQVPRSGRVSLWASVRILDDTRSGLGSGEHNDEVSTCYPHHSAARHWQGSLAPRSSKGTDQPRARAFPPGCGLSRPPTTSAARPPR